MPQPLNPHICQIIPSCVDSQVSNLDGSWSIFLQAISAILVFLVGQAILKFIIEPLQTYKMTKAEISYILMYRENIITNSGLKPKFIAETSKDLREAACRINTHYQAIPFKKLLSFYVIEDSVVVKKSIKNLILLSNRTAEKGNELENANVIDELISDLNLDV